MPSPATDAFSNKGDENESDLTELVVDWLRADLDDPDINPLDNFLDIGAHSLTFTRLNRYLYESRGIALDMRATYNESLASACQRAVPAAPL